MRRNSSQNAPFLPILEVSHDTLCYTAWFFSSYKLAWGIACVHIPHYGTNHTTLTLISDLYVHTYHYHCIIFSINVSFKILMCLQSMPVSAHNNNSNTPSSRIHPWSVWKDSCCNALTSFIILVYNNNTVKQWPVWSDSFKITVTEKVTFSYGTPLAVTMLSLWLSARYTSHRA